MSVENVMKLENLKNEILKLRINVNRSVDDNFHNLKNNIIEIFDTAISEESVL